MFLLNNTYIFPMTDWDFQCVRKTQNSIESSKLQIDYPHGTRHDLIEINIDRDLRIYKIVWPLNKSSMLLISGLYACIGSFK